MFSQIGSATLAATLALASPLAAEDAWIAYDRPELGFSIRFPAEPAVDRWTDATGATSVELHADDGRRVYGVVVTDLRPLAGPDAGRRLCASALDGAGRQRNAEVLWRTATETAEGAALDVGLNIRNELVSRRLYYCAAGRVHALAVTATGDDLDDLNGPEAERFFASFRRWPAGW